MTQAEGWTYRHRTHLLVCLTAAGLFFRFNGVQRVSFAEDEVNKINAVRSYQKGDFTPNAEHPMLMKGLIFLAVGASDYYNRSVAPRLGWPAVPEEVSTRLPNLVFGALTAVPLYLLAAQFFGWRVGLISAALWSTGINAIIINRVAKEDTLLVFFMLLAFHFHRRMKVCPDAEPGLKRRCYYLAAACFGLMLGSKYFPHFIAISMGYLYFHRRLSPAGYPPDSYSGKDLLKFFAVLLAVFLVVNPMVLNPAVICYLLFYSEEGTVVHHGYNMEGEVLYNNVGKTPFGGTPWYFYFLYVGVKFPPLVVVAILLGLAWLIPRWKEAGPFFLLFCLALWVLPYSFAGVKFVRYTLTLVPFLYVTAACGIEWACLRAGAAARSVAPRARALASSCLMLPAAWVACAIPPLAETAPYYSLYVNVLGGGRSNVGWFFPHDEYYDLEMREAVLGTLSAAAPGRSVFAGQTPALFRYYLNRAGRGDARVVNLSDPRFTFDGGEDVFVFLQPGRLYFENREFFTDLWGRVPPHGEIAVGGKPAIRVFRMDVEAFQRVASRRTFFETPDRQRR